MDPGKTAYTDFRRRSAGNAVLVALVIALIGSVAGVKQSSRVPPWGRRLYGGPPKKARAKSDTG